MHILVVFLLVCFVCQQWYFIFSFCSKFNFHMYVLQNHHKKYAMPQKCRQHIKHQHTLAFFMHTTPVTLKLKQYKLKIMCVLFRTSYVTDVTACQIKYHKKLPNTNCKLQMHAQWCINVINLKFIAGVYIVICYVRCIYTMIR